MHTGKTNKTDSTPLTAESNVQNCFFYGRNDFGHVGPDSGDVQSPTVVNFRIFVEVALTKAMTSVFRDRVTSHS